MYCIECGELREEGNYCPACGHKHILEQTVAKSKKPFLILSAFLLAIGLFIHNEQIVSPVDEATVDADTRTEQQTSSNKKTSKVDALVKNAQKSVFTITSLEAQGTAFLFDNQGHIVTNAHVVEGQENMDVKALNGDEYTGTVIGYSKDEDIAMLEVAELKGKQPFPIEMNEVTRVNDSIITLGSPNGREGTVTFGKVKRLNQEVMVDDTYYMNMYQMSAVIDTGSSGGPLISKDRQKVIGINTAKSLDSSNINYSIPISHVKHQLFEWTEQPMTPQELHQNYNEDWLY